MSSAAFASIVVALDRPVLTTALREAAR